MKDLTKTKEKLWRELEEITRKNEINAGDLEMLHKLTDTIKNIDKICMLEDGDGGYSNRYRDIRYMHDDDYDRDSSSANRGKHFVRGHYSREDERDTMLYKLGKMMEGATDREREALRECMETLRMI